MTYHYVYKIEFETGHFYFGVRSSKCIPEKDSYLGSPSTFKHYWDTYSHKKYIISIWPTRKEANIVEDLLIKWAWSVNKSLSLNAGIGGIDFCTFGKKQSSEEIERLVEINSKDYVLVDPQGKIKNIHNLSKFCRENNLRYSSIQSVLCGVTFQHKGYRLAIPKNIDVVFTNKRLQGGSVVNPKGEIFNFDNLKLFCEEYNLEPGKLSKVIRGISLVYKGWRKNLPENQGVICSSDISSSKKYYIKSPTGDIHTIWNLSVFCRESGLCRTSLTNLKNGKIKSYKGWTILQSHV